MTKPENLTWRDRSNWIGRTIWRAILCALAWMMVNGTWALFQEFWNGVPFRSVTRLMHTSDWDSRFGVSDFMIYLLMSVLMASLTLIFVAYALLTLLSKEFAHDVLTSMKSALFSKRC